MFEKVLLCIPSVAFIILCMFFLFLKIAERSTRLEAFIFLSPIILALLIQFYTFFTNLEENSEAVARFVDRFLKEDLIAVFFVVSILLFGLRSRFSLFYGLVETTVGMTAIIAAVTTSPEPTVLTRFISVSGGIYIIVRGLDNMGRTLSKWEKTKNVWRVICWEDNGIEKPSQPG